MSLKCAMILGDCFDVMPTLPEKYFRFIFSDPPFSEAAKQHTANAWDRSFNACALLQELLRLGFGALAIMCNARLLSSLIRSSAHEFRYDLIWHKSRPSGHLNANLMPMRAHEHILVFGPPKHCYNPQMRKGQPRNSPYQNFGESKSYGAQKTVRARRAGSDKFPISVIATKPIVSNRNHPTQKPIALLDWLIRTYSNPGDNVLDPTSGSGTTACAAIMADRNVTCIERDEVYFDASVARVERIISDNKLDVALEVRR